MYFANFALSLLKTCSRLKVVEEEIQGAGRCPKSSGFLFVSPYLSAKDYSVFFSLFILFIF